MIMNRFTQGVGLVAKVVLVGSSVALLGAACWKGAGTNGNAGAGNGNAEVNVNVAANTTTNTNSASEIDTSDWLTYMNEEYGFSFRYPGEWKIVVSGKTPVQGSDVIQGIHLVNITDSLESFVIDIIIQNSELFSTMTETEVLAIAPDRELMPLISEETLTINELPAYRSLRQLKKGELLRPAAQDSTERAEKTFTELGYSYWSEPDLFSITGKIQGEDYNQLITTMDIFAQSFKR